MNKQLAIQLMHEMQENAWDLTDENAYQIDTIEFDEAECDAFCLAEDLRNEFDIDQDQY